MSGFIEGENRQQSTLFPERIDDYVEEDSVVRVVDVFIDRLDISGLGFKTEHADTGRPGYHPRTLLKLYVYGYVIESWRATVKHPFGTLKHWMGRAFLTRQLTNASTEMSLHVLAYNMKRAMKLIGATKNPGSDLTGSLVRRQSRLMCAAREEFLHGLGQERLPTKKARTGRAVLQKSSVL